ncbi:nucleolar protein 56 [Acrasis kona]|uniref:Nucleolar protein 56 n=1 Tax=Acrasis kona TaxID=1008807 RepID=A0AAW2YM13_9EUKA
MPSYLLFESALGYALFERHKQEEIAVKQIRGSLADFSKLSDMVKFVAFAPFESPEHGLENVNNVSEGILHPFLSNFLEMHLGTKKVKLGILETKLGGAIQEQLSKVECFTDDSTQELIRGVRMHFHQFIDGVEKGDVEKAQLGLGHAYSRAKVKFNVNKADNMIIQSISLLDTLDKDLNTYSMRIREWYGWHFPELNKVVKDNVQYAKLVKLIGSKSNLNDEMVDALTDITKDEEVSKEIVTLGRSSMGTDIAPFDLIILDSFAKKVVSIAEYRKNLYDYLQTKMHNVAPNLTCLLGEQVGARLIAHAGSMINLSKYPASTVQILGAEKALFRALKTRGNTPKYGLIYHSSFIGRASKQNKGKVSRYLANKCSIAVRIDSFQDSATSKFGERLRDQVEERLNFYEKGGEGVTLQKNVDVMREVAAEIKADGKSDDSSSKKKRKADDTEEEPPKKKSKKEDKKKKTKVESDSSDDDEEPVKEKKDKKKDKKKSKKDDSDSEDEPPKKKSKKEKKDDSDSSDDEEPVKKEKKDKKDKKSKKDKKDKKDKKNKKEKKSKK